MQDQKDDQNDRGWEIISQNDYKWSIDHENKITEVNDSWLNFAKAAGVSLSRKNVIGHSLFEFIKDEDVKTIYKLFIDRVRQTKKAIVIPYRCDSPDLRRFMEMVIDPQNGEILFTGREVRTEKKEAVSLFDSTKIKRSNKNITYCSNCLRINVNEEWLDVEKVIIVLELFNQKDLPKIISSICDDCQNASENH